MKNNLHKRKGFTIIEVVLVLAIAALIILMVFIAWPALQRTQRDQARKNDVALIGSTIGTFKANNKGTIPNACELNTLVAKQGTSIYGAVNCDSGTNAPGGSSIITPPHNNDFTTKEIDKVYYIARGRCDGNTAKRDGSNRQAALAFAVEANGGEPNPQCQDV